MWLTVVGIFQIGKQKEIGSICDNILAIDAKPPKGKGRQFFSELGPGLITGAADDGRRGKIQRQNVGWAKNGIERERSAGGTK